MKHQGDFARTILVTGGGGFLGQAIVRLLIDRGDRVISFSRGYYSALEALGVKQVDGSMIFNPSFETRLEPGATVIAVGQEQDLFKLEKILCPV